MQGCNANLKEKVKLAGKGILVQGNSANISMFSITILTVKTVFTQFSTIMASWLLLTFFHILAQLSSIYSVITY